MRFPTTLFNSKFREEVSEVECHWRSSLIIRIVVLILAIGAACIVSLLPLYGQLLWFVNIAIGMSGIWALVVIVFRLFMIRPIHPGVHVAFELIAWSGLMAIETIAYMLVFEFLPSSGRIRWDIQSTTTTAIWAANLSICLVLSILTVLHFYLFVRACIDTSRQRSHEIATRAATIAAQIMKNMESRGTFYRRDSDISYGFGPYEESASGHIIGLENLDLRRADINDSRTLNETGSAPLFSSRLSEISRARSRRTATSQARTRYSHTRSMSVPVPTSPRSLRTALTDEPSFFRLDLR